jgi:hypothetical protein
MHNPITYNWVHYPRKKKLTGFKHSYPLRIDGDDTGIMYHLMDGTHKLVRLNIDLKVSTVNQIYRWMKFQKLLEGQKPIVRLKVYVDTLIRGEAELLKNDLVTLNKVVRARYKKINLSQYIQKEI